MTSLGDYSTLTWEFTANFPIDKLQFVFGKVGGTISCDDFTLTKAGSDENLIENGDFAEESASGWGQTGCSIKVASAAAAVEVEQEVNQQTYTDGPFPFFAMGCEPPVVNGAIHFCSNRSLVSVLCLCQVATIRFLRVIMWFIWM